MSPEDKAKVLDSYDDLTRRLVKKYDNMGIVANAATGKLKRDQVRELRGVAAALQNPAHAMVAVISNAFTGMENEAVRRLRSFGYSPSAARSIVATGQVGNPAIESGMNLQGLITPESQRDTRATSSGQNDTNLNVPTNAGGGRIPGMGLYDTVPLGGIAAPGELVVNRHTEQRVNSFLAMMGTNLEREVGREKRPHYAPVQSAQLRPWEGIMPGLATGGRAVLDGSSETVNAAGVSSGAADSASLMGNIISEANRIDALRLPYSYGGGHGTPAPPDGPFDCSSSVSRVFQAAGMQIPTMTSQAFLNWGQSGMGALSVGVRPGGGRSGHVYMIVNGHAWGTSPENPGGGPGWISGYTTRPGFTYRHWPEAGDGTVGPASLIPGLGAAMPNFPDIVPPKAKGLPAFAAGADAVNKGIAAAMTAKIRERMQQVGPPGGGLPAGFAGATEAQQWVLQGMALAGVSGEGWMTMLMNQAQHESGLSPTAQNNWDSNAASGTPSRGFLQTIDSTFNAFAVPGHNDIWNPVDNTAAAIRYMISRYGHGDPAQALSTMLARGYIGYGLGGRMGMDAAQAAPPGASAGRGGGGMNFGPINVTINVEGDGGGSEVGQRVKTEIMAALREAAHELALDTGDDW